VDAVFSSSCPRVTWKPGARGGAGPTGRLARRAGWQPRRRGPGVPWGMRRRPGRPSERRPRGAGIPNTRRPGARTAPAGYTRRRGPWRRGDRRVRPEARPARARRPRGPQLGRVRGRGNARRSACDGCRRTRSCSTEWL